MKQSHDTQAMQELMMSNMGLEYGDNCEQYEQGFDENENVHGSKDHNDAAYLQDGDQGLDVPNASDEGHLNMCVPRLH